MPSKKSTTRVSKIARGKRPVRLKKAFGPAFTLMVVVGVLAIGMLIASQQSGPAEVAAREMRPEVPMEAPASSKGVVVSYMPVEAPTASAAVVKAPPVTITGCLERTDATFRLKDTAGEAAPKARSWKSGFLKKGSASIEVVDAAHTLKLSNNVGRRVSVTGTLVDREMQARSLQRVAPSCNQRSGN